MSDHEFINKLVKEHEKRKVVPGPLKSFIKWFFLCVFIISAGLALTGIRHNIGDMIHTPRFIFESVLLLLITLTSAIAALHLAIPGEERKFKKILLFLPFLLWGFELTTLLVLDVLIYKQPIVITPGWMCSSSILLIGLPCALFLYFIIQRCSPTLPKWTGWFALIAAFSLSALAEQFACHNSEPIHLLIWHFLPVLILGLFGMWIFKKTNRL